MTKLLNPCYGQVVNDSLKQVNNVFPQHGMPFMMDGLCKIASGHACIFFEHHVMLTNNNDIRGNGIKYYIINNIIRNNVRDKRFWDLRIEWWHPTWQMLNSKHYAHASWLPLHQSYNLQMTPTILQASNYLQFLLCNVLECFHSLTSALKSSRNNSSMCIMCCSSDCS